MEGSNGSFLLLEKLIEVHWPRDCLFKEDFSKTICLFTLLATTSPAFLFVHTNCCAMAARLQNAVTTAFDVNFPARNSSESPTTSKFSVIRISSGVSKPQLAGTSNTEPFPFFVPSRYDFGRSHDSGMHFSWLSLFAATLSCQELDFEVISAMQQKLYCMLNDLILAVKISVGIAIILWRYLSVESGMNLLLKK